MGLLKLHSLCKYHKGWHFLLNQISSLENQQLQAKPSPLEYQSNNDENINFSDYINVYTNKFKTASTILIKIYFFTATLFILSPFIEQILCKLIESMECVTYPHILPCWSPLDDITFIGYLITVVSECLAAAYCVSVHLAFDLMSFGVMIFVCGQFSLLREYSSLIGGKGKKCNLSKKRDDRAHFRIKQCHHTNFILVKSITELDKLLVNIIGVYFFVATLTLCSVAVRLQTEVMGPMQLVSLIQYMCATLTQLFVFCRFGDAVMNESSLSMGQGPYAAATWCLSPRIRRDLAILSASMMRPRRLRAGPFSYLDLPSFIQVIRTAYSYYAVLGKRGQ
ncbi:odorant receptor 13a-like [Trichoplusia ni]|uniref:Odorant receptor 13a-like n=1 Tax=Trichoplusia ni TaxID=7111 RepID=A0A7E5VVY9_TRINI|nr:odorant receptor 13a-like [Trichoplusia ni]